MSRVEITSYVLTSRLSSAASKLSICGGISLRVRAVRKSSCNPLFLARRRAMRCEMTRKFQGACARSPGAYAAAFYNTTLGNPVQAIKVAGMVVISMVLVLRSARLFIRFNTPTLTAAGLYVIAAWRFGVVRTVTMSTIAATVLLSILLHDMPTDNEGHRAGGHGFGGPRPENSLEALQDLIRRDNKAPLEKLAYVEFDVHETKDGELVVFHDARLERAVSDAGVNAAPAAALRAGGLNCRTATIQQLTLVQLRSFHLGGVEGIRIPTLDEYLSCCRKDGLRRSVAVEVKRIVTDAGRRKLLAALRQYKAQSDWLEATYRDLVYWRFGSIAAIAFPWTWAQSFGEFGTEQWRFWACQFKAARIPVKSCVFHWLLLTHRPE